MRAANLTEALANQNKVRKEADRLDDERQDLSIACEQGRATEATMARYREVVESLGRLVDEAIIADMEVKRHYLLKEAEGWEEAMTHQPCANIDFGKCEREKKRCLAEAAQLNRELCVLEGGQA